MRQSKFIAGNISIIWCIANDANDKAKDTQKLFEITPWVNKTKWLLFLFCCFALATTMMLQLVVGLHCKQTNGKKGPGKSEKSFSEMVTFRRKGHNCKRDKSVENDTYDEPLLIRANRYIYIRQDWVLDRGRDRERQNVCVKEIEKEDRTSSQCVSVLRVTWLSIKSKIIIPISDCRIGFIFVSMSCNTFSRKNTIKNNMLMSRTKHTQTHSLSVCSMQTMSFIRANLFALTLPLSSVRWCCFDVDFIAVTRCDIPSVVVIHQFAYAMMSVLFRWNYENWCWISTQEGKICSTNWIRRALSGYLPTQNAVNVAVCLCSHSMLTT